jgi:hypothetical protein
VRQLVDVMTHEGEPVPEPGTGPARVVRPSSYSATALRQLSQAERQALASALLARTLVLERSVREAAERAQQLQPTQPNWEEVARILGRLAPGASDPTLVNTLTQRVRRLIARMHAARAKGQTL